MDMCEGRGVQSKITVRRQCRLLPSLPKSRTKATTMLRTPQSTNLLKKFPLYPIPVTISWSRLPMSLVMDTLHRHTPQLMTSHTSNPHISHLCPRGLPPQVRHPSK